MTPTPPPVRIAVNQARLSRSMQALMIADNEIEGLVYRGPFQLANKAQREALLHIYNTEFNTTITLPEIPTPRRPRKNDPLPKEDQIGSLIAFLVIIDNEPVLFYEEDHVLAAVFGFVMGRYGIAVARRVTFREGMLPPPPEVPAS